MGVREAVCTSIADKTMCFCAMICDNRAFGKIIKNTVKSRLCGLHDCDFTPNVPLLKEKLSELLRLRGKGIV